MQNLTTTVFTSGPMDTLRVVDAYGIESDVVINSIQIEENAGDLEAAMALVPPTAMEQLGAGIVGAGQVIGQTASDVQNALNGISANVNGTLSAIAAIPGELKNAILAPLGIPNIQAVVGDVKATINNIKNLDITKVKAVGALISAVGGGIPMEFKDLGALSTLGSNVINQANAMGIPNAYAAVCSGIQDLTVVANITKQILPNVINTSSINLLNQIANGPVAGKVKSIMPGFIPEFTKNFQLAKGITQNEKINTAIAALGAFNKIDPGWDQIKAMPGQVVSSIPTFSGQVISGASNDFKDALNSLSRVGATTPAVGGLPTVQYGAEQRAAVCASSMYQASAKPTGMNADGSIPKATLDSIKDFYSKQENAPFKTTPAAPAARPTTVPTDTQPMPGENVLYSSRAMIVPSEEYFRQARAEADARDAAAAMSTKAELNKSFAQSYL